MKNRSLTAVLLCLALVILAAGISAQDNQTPHESATATQIDSVTPTEEAAVTASEDAAAHDEEESPKWRRPMGVLDFLMTGKYFWMMILMMAGLILLFGKWVNKPVRIGMMVVVFVLYGLDYFFPMHPSPMCGVTKLFMFKITRGVFFPAFSVVFLTIMVPSLFGRKLFCGWVCPLGALQELVNKIPFPWRKKNFNFAIFNGIRMALLVFFFLTFWGVKDHIAALADAVGANAGEGMWLAFAPYNVYEPINLFELLHWQIDTLFFVLMGLLVVFSLVLYRPFCYAVCPIGALTWLLERVSPGRIRVDQNACTQCGLCSEASPCPTIDPLVEGKSLVPDCTSCGECIRSCPENAISFGFTAKKQPTPAPKP